MEVIDELAFNGCSALTEFMIGDKVTTIGKSAFSGCTSYAIDKIPDSVISLGSWAFNRTAIKSLEIGSGIKTIPAYCFRDCSALENVVFKEGLVYIRNYAFSNDSNLIEVTIPESVATIGTDAFPSTTTLKLLSDKYTDMGNNSYKTIYTAKTNVYQNYEYAFEVFEEVNKIREEKGLNPLTMDVDLLEYAMQRATEASLLFAHLRPTGSLPAGATYENLGRNYTSPEAMVELWMKDDHSVPILDANMKAIGVGVVVNDGYYMWSQEFTGVLKEEAKASSYSNSDKTYEINYSTDVIITVNPTITSVTLNEGQESDAVSAELGGALLVPDSLFYSSSDENVCVVSKDGKITGKAAGSAEITIRLSDQNNSDVLYVTVPVKVNHEWDSDYTVEKEATCTEDGVKSIHCKNCQATKDSVVIPATGHISSDLVKENQVEASCSKEGSYDEVIYCSVCKQEISRETKALPKAEHTWDEGTITKEATEEEAGVKTYTCSVCGETKTEEIPALEHTHKFTEEVVEPTCTEAGYTIYTCKCGETYKDNEKPALGHTYTSKVTKEATCKEEGERTYTCERCEDSYTEKIEKIKEHTWDEGTITKEATEEEAGVKTYTCSVCGETKTEEIPALEHTHKFTEEVVEPTCTEGGYTVHTCKCGETFKDNETSALGHTWNKDYTVDKKATCIEEGSESIHCIICNEIKDGSQRTIEKEAHDYGEWKIVKKATKISEGLKERTCKNCGDKVTDKIQKIVDSNDSSNPGVVSPEKPALIKKIVKQITNAKKDADLKGSSFSLLQAKGLAKSKSSVKVSWKKVPGAKAYIVYGNKCGSKNKFKKLKTITDTSFTQRKLKKGTYYKYLIVAVNGDKVLAISKTIHVATKGGKAGNIKSITIKPKKTSISFQKNKTYKLNTKAVAQSKKLKVQKHRPIAYESCNQKVAAVSGKGVIKAVGKGTCYVYVYAQNGVSKKIKVVVK